MDVKEEDMQRVSVTGEDASNKVRGRQVFHCGKALEEELVGDHQIS